MRKFNFTLVLSCVFVFAVNAQLLRNDFMLGIINGETIEKGSYATKTDPALLNQWNLCEHRGDNYIGGSSSVATTPLIYANYVESGVCPSIDLAKITEPGKSRLFGYSLTDSNEEYAAGTYYLSFLINVPNSGELIASPYAAVVMFDGSSRVDFQRICVGIGRNQSPATKVKFFIADKDVSNPATDGAQYDGDGAEYDLGTTHLIIMKYNMDTDVAELFVNPAMSETEPAPNASITNGDLKSIKGISVRRRTNYAAVIGGLRFSTTWKAAIGLDNISTNREVLLINKGEIVAEEYFNMAGIRVQNLAEKGMYIKKISYKNGIFDTQKIYVSGK